MKVGLPHDGGACELAAAAVPRFRRASSPPPDLVAGVAAPGNFGLARLLPRSVPRTLRDRTPPWWRWCTETNSPGRSSWTELLQRRSCARFAGTLTLGFANLAGVRPLRSGAADRLAVPGRGPQPVVGRGRAGRAAARAGTGPGARDAAGGGYSADILLDLHSMLWPSEPLLLCGPTEKGADLARAIGTPGLVVADEGHASGRRLIDYGRFAEPDGPVALLVEAGQHWQAATVAQARASVRALLRHWRHGARALTAASASPVRAGDAGGDRGDVRVQLPGALPRRRHRTAWRHPDRTRRRRRGAHAARRLPAGDAEPAHRARATPRCGWPASNDTLRMTRFK